MSVAAALRREWLCDAYLVQYRFERAGVALTKGCRIRKDQLEVVRDHGIDVVCGVRISDLDTKPKRLLTREDTVKIAKVLNRYPCCWYPTRHGARVLQPLTRDLSPEELEVSLRRWLLELQPVVVRMGVPDLAVDMGCTDWTRLMRLPRVVRLDFAEGARNYANLWATPVLGLDCEAVDPGDCTPPPKPVRAEVPCAIAERTTAYGLSAMTGECERLAAAKDGDGNSTLASCAWNLGGLIASGNLDRDEAVQGLRAALYTRGHDPEAYERTLQRCLSAGEREPRGPDPTARIARGPWVMREMGPGVVVTDHREAKALQRRMRAMEIVPEYEWE